MFKNIGVLGTGTMGLDIAQVFAASGMNVTLQSRSEESVKKAEAKLTSGLSRRLERGKITKEYMDQLLSNIRFTTKREDLKNMDLIVESVIEDADVKKATFAELDAICSENTVFATNTSSISITDIAAATKRPEKFIGMHFFNPATVMKLVEVIRGMHTSDETYSAVFELSKEIGKEPVEVQEAPGFVVNRLLIPMINEAVGLLADGVASAEGIDTAMKLGANHPMGPLALADLIGLDVCLAIMDTLYRETQDSKYRAHTLLRKMVRGGLLGKKTGRGFFDYAK